MRVFATPEYLKALTRHGLNPADPLFPSAFKALYILSRGGQPTWVIAGPAVPAGRHLPEDEGRTFKINAPFKFFAIRDDHPAGCECGCGGGSVVTFLLPDEY